MLSNWQKFLTGNKNIVKLFTKEIRLHKEENLYNRLSVMIMEYIPFNYLICTKLTAANSVKMVVKIIS